jgi:hypothetical protein
MVDTTQEAREYSLRHLTLINKCVLDNCLIVVPGVQSGRDPTSARQGHVANPGESNCFLRGRTFASADSKASLKGERHRTNAAFEPNESQLTGGRLREPLPYLKGCDRHTTFHLFDHTAGTLQGLMYTVDPLVRFIL